MKAQETEVTLPSGPPLRARVAVPEGAAGIVLFAHGSGSGRLSPRNQAVARQLQAAGLGTVLMDLLTAEEEPRDRETAELRFDVRRLARRLAGATGWVRRQSWGQADIGYFGASTGAAAALVASTQRADVKAVVSRGGRPDLAAPALPYVLAPTLLIVGGADTEVLAMNREALAQLRAEKHLVVVPGATHLFEEPGALEQVGQLARGWFLQHLGHGGEVSAA
ncbi:MAG: dienelactone hydrolase family protein [Terriglobales bacterium]